MLGGHTGVVKAVTFLPSADDTGVSYLLTGADDFKLKLWSISRDLTKWECLQTVDAHAASITCLAPLKSWSPAAPVLVASGAADYSIKIWRLDAGQLHPVQTIKTAQEPRYFPLTLALCAVGSNASTLILAAGGTRRTIHVFGASAQGDISFTPQATLAGHEDWVRSLDFTLETGDPATSDLLLASASQDKYIRLWRVHEGHQPPPPSASAAADPLRDAHVPGGAPSNKAHRLSVAGRDFSVTFEALLLGHEDWIYAARWNRGPDGPPRLLSASADNSLAVWEPDPVSGVWASTTRLGEISRDKGATTATGSIGGFWTGLWSADGRSMVCLGRTGSWRRWDYSDEDAAWKPALAVTGHTKPVTGIAWARSGAHLLSSSADQTTRLHAPWTARGGSWHEMSRPQIHGYDLNCVDSLGDAQFVSGADEKLLRVFRAPRAVARLLSRLSALDSGADADAAPDAANIPVLGLSNKAVDDAAAGPDEGAADDTATDALRSALEIDRPPFEDALSRYTLWPETEKLYGHGYEMSCLGASHDGALIASACKASAATHAVIRLFETRRWTEVRPPLVAHGLTATRVRFSPDDRYLLSVGRDRQWAVFGKNEGEGEGEGEGHGFALAASNPKGHSRMILDAAWGPEGLVFATAGRDKQAKVWKGGEADGKVDVVLATAIPSAQAVTAVDFLPRKSREGNFVLAVGDEAGRVSICTLDAGDLSLVARGELDPGYVLSPSPFHPLR